MLRRPFKEQFSNEALVSAHTAIQIKDYTVLGFYHHATGSAPKLAKQDKI